VRRVRSWRDALTLIGFLAPALALLSVFTVWPAAWAVYQSFTNKALTGFEARAPPADNPRV
jgi:ABC-type sugar transport system permease subunit